MALDPDDIAVDARTFQFKAGGDEAGVTERLQGVETFDPRLAGMALVYEAQDGRLAAHVWKRWSDTLSWWMSLPGVQAWWHAKPTPFNERFSEFVDARFRTPSFDAMQAQRWRQFLDSQAARDAQARPATPTAEAPGQ